MKLEGSCHCQSVRFSIESDYAHPFNYCYCSICRKTAGSGGFAINLSADARTLIIDGEEHLGVYQVQITNPEAQLSEKSPAQRKFCLKCGSHLWVWNPKWPELLHPHAGAIDTELPIAPEQTHLMLASKSQWVPVEEKHENKYFDEYPDESIADWHDRVLGKK